MENSKLNAEEKKIRRQEALKEWKRIKEMDQDNDGIVTEEEFVSDYLSQNRGTGNLSAKLALGIVDVFVMYSDAMKRL